MAVQILVVILSLLVAYSSASALTMVPPKDGGTLPPQWDDPWPPFFEKKGNAVLRITDISLWKNPLYAVITVKFPDMEGMTDIRVLVDGQEVNTRQISGTYTPFDSAVKLLFFPGKAGRKTVTAEASVGDRILKSNREFIWMGDPQVVLADHFGTDELVQAGVKLRLVAANVDEMDITLNGVKIPAEGFGRDAKLYTVQPAWVAGKNELKVVARTSGGTTINRVYTFVYADKGQLGQGDSMFVGLDARMRGKSGPWFDLKIEGDSVAAAKRGERRIVQSLTPDGWLVEDEKTAVQLTAVKPGRSIVRIMRHANFLPEPEVDQEIVLQVIQAGK